MPFSLPCPSLKSFKKLKDHSTWLGLQRSVRPGCFLSWANLTPDSPHSCSLSFTFISFLVVENSGFSFAYGVLTIWNKLIIHSFFCLLKFYSSLMPQCLKRRVPCHHWELCVLIAQCYTLQSHTYNLYDCTYICVSFWLIISFLPNTYLCGHQTYFWFCYIVICCCLTILRCVT